MKKFLVLLSLSSSVAFASAGADGEIPGYVVAQVINVFLLIGIIYFWQGKTIASFFHDKRENFLTSVQAASSAKDEAENKKNEIEKRLRDLKSNFQKDLEDAKKNAEESYRIQVSEARNEALRIEKDADTAMDGETQKVIESLRVETFEKSVDMAEKKLGQSLTAEQQKTWNDAFATRVKGAH